MQHHAYSRLGSLGGGAVPAVVSAATVGEESVGDGRLGEGGGRDQGRRGEGRSRRKRRGAESLAALLRRQAVFLFAPLLYVAAMLPYMGSISLDSMPRIISRPSPGSMYRSPQLYARLRADMDADNAIDAWMLGLCLVPSWVLGSLDLRNVQRSVSLIVGCES